MKQDAVICRLPAKSTGLMKHAKGNAPVLLYCHPLACAHPCVLWRSYDGKLRSSMLEYFDEELCDWLMTEMAQNRDKKLVAKKVCNFL